MNNEKWDVTAKLGHDQTLAASVYSQIALSGEDIDTENNRYIAEDSGRIQLKAEIVFNKPPHETMLTGRILRNGQLEHEASHLSSGQSTSRSVFSRGKTPLHNATVELHWLGLVEEGDAITLEAFQDSNEAVELDDETTVRFRRVR